MNLNYEFNGLNAFREARTRLQTARAAGDVEGVKKALDDAKIYRQRALQARSQEIINDLPQEAKDTLVRAFALTHDAGGMGYWPSWLGAVLPIPVKPLELVRLRHQVLIEEGFNDPTLAAQGGGN